MSFERYNLIGSIEIFNCHFSLRKRSLRNQKHIYRSFIIYYQYLSSRTKRKETRQQSFIFKINIFSKAHWLQGFMGFIKHYWIWPLLYMSILYLHECSGKKSEIKCNRNLIRIRKSSLFWIGFCCYNSRNCDFFQQK